MPDAAAAGREQTREIRVTSDYHSRVPGGPGLAADGLAGWPRAADPIPPQGREPMKPILLSAALLVAATAAQGQPQGLPEPPPLPEAGYRGETIEPEVTIIETGQELIYEYRVRGRLYMVRVQPQVGPPYFLLDLNGDGMLDAQEVDPRNISIPQWVLFSW